MVIRATPCWLQGLAVQAEGVSLPSMLSCESCGRRHRDKEGIEKCALRVQKRIEREKRRAEDLERREKNQEECPPRQLIREMLRDKYRWVHVVARLNKEYPKPPSGKWTLANVVELDSERLNWPDWDQEILWPDERISIGALIKAVDKAREGE